MFVGWITLLVLGIVVGLVAAFLVFTQGLTVTNLTDLVPWGLWIVVDLSSIALAGGAFFLSALVYVLGIKRFKPIARLAVFTGILAYTSALSTLMLDIGRPDRFWHSLAYWNTHSMLWEVTMSIFLYFNVLLLEVFPLIASHRFFDRLPSVRAAAEFVHGGAPILAFLGLFFSMLHQSSLGATYGVVIARPIWFRPTMPLLFIASAIAAGTSVNIAAAMVVRWLRGRDVVPREVLFDIGKIAAAVLLIYLNIRFWDIWAGNYSYVPLRSEGTALLTSGPLAMNFWGWEIALGVLIPSFLLIWSAKVRSEASLFLGSALVVIGLIINRWNTTLVGFTTPLTVRPALTYPLMPTYTPGLVEWATVIGIVSAVVLGFTLGMRYLPVFELQADSHSTSSVGSNS
jgi:molybdopterin-containing oxidoreductase family membrane subunit